MTQAQGNYPPKLTFLPNTPVQVYFPYGDCKEIPSTKGYSPSYLYSVEEGDVKVALRHAWPAPRITDPQHRAAVLRHHHQGRRTR